MFNSDNNVGKSKGVKGSGPFDEHKPSKVPTKDFFSVLSAGERETHPDEEVDDGENKLKEKSALFGQAAAQSAAKGKGPSKGSLFDLSRTTGSSGSAVKGAVGGDAASANIAEAEGQVGEEGAEALTASLAGGETEKGIETFFNPPATSKQWSGVKPGAQVVVSGGFVGGKVDKKGGGAAAPAAPAASLFDLSRGKAAGAVSKPGATNVSEMAEAETDHDASVRMGALPSEKSSASTNIGRSAGKYSDATAFEDTLAASSFQVGEESSGGNAAGKEGTKVGVSVDPSLSKEPVQKEKAINSAALESGSDRGTVGKSAVKATVEGQRGSAEKGSVSISRKDNEKIASGAAIKSEGGEDDRLVAMAKGAGSSSGSGSSQNKEKKEGINLESKVGLKANPKVGLQPNTKAAIPIGKQVKIGSGGEAAGAKSGGKTGGSSNKVAFNDRVQLPGQEIASEVAEELPTSRGLGADGAGGSEEGSKTSLPNSKSTAFSLPVGSSDKGYSKESSREVGGAEKSGGPYTKPIQNSSSENSPVRRRDVNEGKAMARPLQTRLEENSTEEIDTGMPAADGLVLAEADKASQEGSSNPGQGGQKGGTAPGAKDFGTAEGVKAGQKAKIALPKEMRQSPEKPTDRGLLLAERDILAAQTPSQKKNYMAATEAEAGFEVNLMASNLVPGAGVSVTQGAEEAASPVSRVQHLQDIVNMMVKSIHQLESAGKSETLVVLNDNSPFAGARISISEYDTAKGQLNVSMGNLTQEAQRIIDMPANRVALQHALEEKGYNVQILITTTSLIDNSSLLTDASNQQNDQQRQREGDGGGEQRQRQQQEGGGGGGSGGSEEFFA